MKMMIEFRHIPPYDYLTPMMYIPLERTIIDVGSPYDKTAAQKALHREFGIRPSDIEDYHVETVEATR